MKPLIIVESLQKFRTIKQMFLSEYNVFWTENSVRFLRSIENGIPEYGFSELNPSTRSSSLDEAIRTTASEVIIATDWTPAGEKMAWHLYDLLNQTIPTKRVHLHAITREKILELSTSSHQEIQYSIEEAIWNMVYSYNITPIVWSALPSHQRQPDHMISYDDFKTLREIRAASHSIKGEGACSVYGYFTNLNIQFILDAHIEDVQTFLQQSMYFSHQYSYTSSQKETEAPPPPYTCETLYMCDSKMTLSEIMNNCKLLYERGFITTPFFNTTPSNEIVSDAKKYILKKFTARHIREEGVASGIYPCDMKCEAIEPKELNKLYIRIWDRAMRSFMSDCQYSVVNALITSPIEGKYYKCSHRNYHFPSWTTNLLSSTEYFYLFHIHANIQFRQIRVEAAQWSSSLDHPLAEHKFRHSHLREFISTKPLVEEYIPCTRYLLTAEEGANHSITESPNIFSCKTYRNIISLTTLGLLMEEIFIPIPPEITDPLDVEKYLKQIHMEKQREKEIHVSGHFIGLYKDQKVYIKKSKYGAYVECNYKTKSVQHLCGNRPLENIRLEEVLDIVRELAELPDVKKSIPPSEPILITAEPGKGKETEKNIVRHFTESLSCRRGLYGNYIYYKTSKMGKPIFFSIDNEIEIQSCSFEDLQTWMLQRHKFRI